MSNYLIQYREAIRRGEIIAGMDMISELDNLIADLNDEQYRYDTKDAELRIDFIEHCIRLTKAPFYGKPMQLMLWQKAFVEVVYSFKIWSIDINSWVDRFQEILLLITRKGGKTEFIAAILLTELLIGGVGIDLVCSGMDDGTADLCYSAIDTMRLLIDPQSIDTWRNQKGIKCFFNNNHIYKLSASTRQREGRNIDMASLDECWSLPADGDIYKSIQQSTSVKDSYKIFIFGSEGFVQDGFLDRKRAEYTKIIQGEDDAESSKRKLPWLYTQDSEQEVWATDENGINKAWQKSNPSIGIVKKWSYLRDRVDEARKSKSDRVFTLAKDFNFKQNAVQAWLTTNDYKYQAVYDIEQFRGSFCLGAVDLSETTDMTSARILLMKPNDRTKFIYQHYFIPESKLTNADDKAAGAKYTRRNLLVAWPLEDFDLLRLRLGTLLDRYGEKPVFELCRQRSHVCHFGEVCAHRVALVLELRGYLAEPGRVLVAAVRLEDERFAFDVKLRVLLCDSRQRCLQHVAFGILHKLRGRNGEFLFGVHFKSPFFCAVLTGSRCA